MLRVFRPLLLLIFAPFLWAAAPASAQEFWEDNYLMDAYTGSHRSSVAHDLSKGGYELSGGEFVSFRDWYTPTSPPDSTVLFLRQMSPDFGLIWGFSTGERGKKYEIDPALHLGFLYRYNFSAHMALTFKATYPFFGAMTEKTCTADYGDLGGVQIVNCRLAASTLPPAETLDYLVHLKGETDAKISIAFTFAF